MSTDWHYAIDLHLKADFAHDIEWILAHEHFRWSEMEADLVAPRFGDDIDYVGRNLSGIEGAAIVDGRLRVSAWVQNLERELGEDDGITLQAGRSRLDVMLDLLTSIGTVSPGDIVGCIRSEHDMMDHAHPLVATADGRIRMVRTHAASLDHGWWGQDVSAERIEIGDRIPLEAVLEQDGVLWLDESRLKQLLSVEMSVAP